MCFVNVKDAGAGRCAKNCSFCKSGNRIALAEINKLDNGNFRQNDFSIKELLLTGNILLKTAPASSCVNNVQSEEPAAFFV